MNTTRQITIGILTVAMLITLAVGSVAKHQHSVKARASASDTKDGLQLSIEIDRDSYRLGDSATMKIRLKNVSRGPIAIFKNLAWGASASFTLGISADRGKLAQKTFLDDAQHRPPFVAEDFITIQPGELVEQERLIGLRREGIKESGVYKVTVWYHSPIPRSFAPEGLQIWAMENGVLRSKPVAFNVT